MITEIIIHIVLIIFGLFLIRFVSLYITFKISQSVNPKIDNFEEFVKSFEN